LVEAEEDDIDGMGDDDDGDYEYGDEMMMDGDEDDLDRPVFWEWSFNLLALYNESLH